MAESLCANCRFMREIRTPRSCFFLCQLSNTDPAYPKYPPQPIRRCQGFQRKSDGDEVKQDETAPNV